jgi:uncharacterized protein YoxC
MNDEQIERLLRQGAAVKTPDVLLGRLKEDIRVPRMEMGRTDWTPAPSWFKRWMPALSFAIILLGCLVAIGVQTSMLRDLRQQNSELASANQNLDALRAQNAELQRLSRQSQELDLLRKDNTEMQDLREEVAKLQTQLQEAAKLRADNQALKAGAASVAASSAGANPDFFAEAKRKAERIQCMNNLKQLGLAVRLWANDNNDTCPPDLISMTNEMGGTWKILQCPSDTSHNVTSWAEVAAGNVSYQYLVPGIKETEDPRTVLFVCPIHHNIGLLDGSVQQLSEDAMNNQLKVVNGRTIWLPGQ